MEWWIFSKSERGAIIGLCAILGALLLVRWLNPFELWATEPDYSRLHQASQVLRSHLAEQAEKEPDKAQPKTVKRENHRYPQKQFAISSTDSATLYSYGAAPFLASRIVRYGDLIGGYTNPESLFKVYGFDSAMWRKWKDSIVFEKESHRGGDGLENNVAQKRVYKDTEDLSGKTYWDEKVSVDINTADTVHLQKVPGIGPYYAKEIVEYRAKLGGFVSMNQLLEIYGMDSAKLAKLTTHIYLGDKRERLSLNSADFEKLYEHPYISYEKAQHIVRYRKQHGDFTSVDDLAKIFTIDQKWIDKMRPYLKL